MNRKIILMCGGLLAIIGLAWSQEGRRPSNVNHSLQFAAKPQKIVAEAIDLRDQLLDCPQIQPDAVSAPIVNCQFFYNRSRAAAGVDGGISFYLQATPDPQPPGKPVDPDLLGLWPGGLVVEIPASGLTRSKFIPVDDLKPAGAGISAGAHQWGPEYTQTITLTRVRVGKRVWSGTIVGTFLKVENEDEYIPVLFTADLSFM